MRRNKELKTGGVPEWSAPWAAGWTAMSDLSRIECYQDRFDAGLNGRPQISSARTSYARLTAIGLTAGALSAVVSLSVALWFLPNG